MDDEQGQGLGVTSVVQTVKRAIAEANISESNEQRDLKVSSFKLSLKTVTVHKAGGGFEFRIPFLGMVLKAGGSVTREDTNTLTVELVAPSDDEVARLAGPSDLQRELVGAVETVRQTVSAASNGADKFELGKAQVEINFVLTKEGTIKLGIEGEKKGAVTQTLELTLSPAR